MDGLCRTAIRHLQGRFAESRPEEGFGDVLGFASVVPPETRAADSFDAAPGADPGALRQLTGLGEDLRLYWDEISHSGVTGTDPMHLTRLEVSESVLKLRQHGHTLIHLVAKGNDDIG